MSRARTLYWNAGNQPKPKGPPFKEKIVVIENATEKPIEVRLRHTDDPYKGIKDNWSKSGPYTVAPGATVWLENRDGKPISAAKVCIRFVGKMTQRCNVPGPPKTRGVFDVYKDEDYGPQMVVCGELYDTPEMTEYVLHL